MLVAGLVDRAVDAGGDRLWDAEASGALLKLLEVPEVRGSGAASIVASLEFLAVGEDRRSAIAAIDVVKVAAVAGVVVL